MIYLALIIIVQAIVQASYILYLKKELKSKSIRIERMLRDEYENNKYFNRLCLAYDELEERYQIAIQTLRDLQINEKH